jgi:DNA invertase Pin-like site-specific DNA recombinase/uncharacterized coiled-coil protein SlyX
MKYIPPPEGIPPGSVVDTYLRDSGGEGQDRSVQSQLEEIQRYCKEHKLTLRRVYKDIAKSGRSVAGRAEFVRLVEDCRARSGNPKGILIWDYARFGRNAQDANWGVVNIEHEDVLIHSIVDDIPEGPYKHVFRSLKHSGNESQSESNSEAVKRMQHQLVKNNKAMFGVPPRGFKRSPLPPVRNERTGEMRMLHQWVPDPAMASLVLRAFEMKAQNKTLAQINQATQLYASVGCYATFWPNKLYKGVLEFGGETIEDYCEPVVPPELWDQVNAMITKNQRKPGNGIADPRRVNSIYLLSGLAHCQECGRALVGHRFKEWEYYLCSHRKLTRGEGCKAERIPKRELEGAVFEAIKNHALSLESIVAFQGKVTHELNRTSVDRESTRIKRTRELAAIEKNIKNWTAAIGKHGYSEALGEALASAEAEHKEIKAEIKQLESEIAIPRKTIAQLKHIAAELKRTLTTGTDEEKRNAIRTFVTRIIANRQQAAINYIPIKIVNPELQGSLGQRMVPPRGLWSEDQILIELPRRNAKVTR